MKRDEQSQREPAVKQRRALDGVDNEKNKKCGPTAGKDKRTDQEN